MRSLARCLLVCAWCASVPLLLRAQPARNLAPPSEAFPLENMQVRGAEHLQPARILAATGLKLGQKVNKSTFDAARERLLATGAFELVAYQFSPSASSVGYDVTFEVNEVLQMYPYRFEDLPVGDARLRESVHQREPLFDEVIPVTQDVIGRYASIFAAAAGVPVEGHLTYSKTGEPSILFRPPGDAPHIYEAHFTGNKILTAEQLTAKFLLIAFGAEYSEAQVRALLDSSVRPLYEAKGRLRVAFPKITAEATKAPEVIGESVTIQIVEGPEYKLGAVNYSGIASKQLKEIDRLADFKKDQTVDFDDVDKALDRIRKRYWGTGYLHAKTSADRSVNDKDHIVDLTVKIDPGPQFTYGKLAIQGLDIFAEPAVRKAWGAREGHPFDPTSPDAFLKEIREGGVFDNLADAHSQTKLNEDTKTADVTLIFKGGDAPKTGPQRTGRNGGVR